MTTVDIKKTIQTKQQQILSKQHQTIHGQMRYLISSVGKFDFLSCVPHIAASNDLKKRIALYRRSLKYLKTVMQRNIDQDSQAFHNSPALQNILQENQDILQRINGTLTIAENALTVRMLREELNVALVKISLSVNALCEMMMLKLVKEEALAKIA